MSQADNRTARLYATLREAMIQWTDEMNDPSVSTEQRLWASYLLELSEREFGPFEPSWYSPVALRELDAASLSVH